MPCVIGFLLLAVSVGASASATTRVAWPRRERAAPSAPRVEFARRRHVFEFPGQGPCQSGFCWTPGEPVIAVGPRDVLETVNTAATVYDKTTGTQLAEFDFDSFWGSQTTSCVDPRALYLASVDRFAFSCTDITTPSSPMRFAISKTSDPTGAWYLYAAPNTTSLDQDKIEATSDKFVIAGNTPSSEAIYVYNLADVVAGVAHPKPVRLTAKDSNLYEAAVEQSSTSPAYFVALYPSQKLYLATITGTPAASDVKLTQQAVSVKDYPAPGEPQVPGGAIGGGDLDGRVYDAVFEDVQPGETPVIQFSSARECGTRTCITSGRLDLSGAKPVLSSYAVVGEPGYDYSYGAVGLDSQGDVFEAYTRSSPTLAPAAGVLGPGFDVPLQAAASGTTACSSGQSPPCDERWGDYLGTAIDPSDPSVVWVTGLYQATSGGFGWGTLIARVSLSSYTLPAVTTGAASSIKASSAVVAGTVSPGGVATTYHIDYGLTTGYDQATPEQSAGSGTSPVPVSELLTHLSPGTVYHYRVVATTATGSAVGADETFTTRKPTITSVGFTGTPADPTITITGSNFGGQPQPDPSTPLTCVSGDTSFDYGPSGLWFEDATQGWTGGQLGDCIGLIVNSYTNTRIVYGLGADYPNFGRITTGDGYTVDVYGKTFTGTVSYS